MRLRRVFSLGPDAQPVPVHLVVQRLGEGWAAMVLRLDEGLPRPGELKGTSFLADGADEAESAALDYLHGLGRLN